MHTEYTKHLREAINHYEYGISHNIFSEPVRGYAKLSALLLKRELLNAYKKALAAWKLTANYQAINWYEEHILKLMEELEGNDEKRID